MHPGIVGLKLVLSFLWLILIDHVGSVAINSSAAEAAEPPARLLRRRLGIESSLLCGLILLFIKCSSFHILKMKIFLFAIINYY